MMPKLSTTLLGVAIAVVILVFGLVVVSCATAPGEPAQGPNGNINNLSVVKVLVDGEYVTCVLYSQVAVNYSAGMGGLSCNWNEASR